MKYNEAIAQVRNMAGDNNVMQFTDQHVLNWLNTAVRECAIINNLLQVTATSNSVVNDFTYILPIDILKLHSILYDNRKIKILTMEEFQGQYPDVDFTEQGEPQVAYVWSGSIHFFPVPGTVKSFKIEYIKDPTDILIAGIDVIIPLPVGYHQRLIDYCLAQVAQQDDDMNRYQIKMQEFITGVQSLKDQPEYEQDLYPFISVSTNDMDYGGYYSW